MSYQEKAIFTLQDLSVFLLETPIVERLWECVLDNELSENHYFAKDKETLISFLFMWCVLEIRTAEGDLNKLVGYTSEDHFQTFVSLSDFYDNHFTDIKEELDSSNLKLSIGKKPILSSILSITL